MTVTVKYFAQLRESVGASVEELTTTATTAHQLWTELVAIHGFSLAQNVVKVAVNDQYRSWDFPLSDGVTVVFIPPVAGG